MLFSSPCARFSKCLSRVNTLIILHMLARQSKEWQGFGMWLRKQNCHMKSPLFTMLENTLALSLNCLNSAFSLLKS